MSRKWLIYSIKVKVHLIIFPPHCPLIQKMWSSPHPILSLVYFVVFCFLGICVVLYLSDVFLLCEILIAASESAKATPSLIRKYVSTLVQPKGFRNLVFTPVIWENPCSTLTLINEVTRRISNTREIFLQS